MAIPNRAKPIVASAGVVVAHKGIRLRAQRLEVSENIRTQFNISATAARVLAARSFEADDRLKNFINPTLRDSLPDPAQLKNLTSGAELIAKYLAASKPIAICCDFDVDGLSGGAQVFHCLRTLGARTKVFVPDRFEDGYGLNEKMIRTIAQEGFALMITIDYGTTNVRELTLARELGVTSIVIDHHHVTEVPPADVFINPQQPGCGFASGTLCAAGLGWYLLVALRNALGTKSFDPRKYLDLACLGTICDMVPLVGANRTIAKRGLELLSVTERPGLVALKQVMCLEGEVGCSDVSFGIGPRINAAGRMVHGDLVIDLLTTSDSVVAKNIAHRLNRLNVERQDAETQVKADAIGILSKRGTLPWGIAVWKEDFHTGVIGIVAQRMVENFYRPAAIMGLDQDGVFKGSVRGIKGFSVIGALTELKSFLIKFGGHEGAGGFSVAADRVEEFASAFDEECEKRLKKLEIVPMVDADTEAGLGEIDLPLVNEMKSFAPFGMGNPNPVLLVRDLKVSEVRVLKDTHLKATFTDGRRYLTGLMWRQNQHPALIPGTKVNIAIRPEISTYGGNTEVQAHLQAVTRVD